MSFFVKTDYLPPGEQNIPERLVPFFWYFVKQAKWQFLSFFSLAAFGSFTWALQPYFFKKFVEIFEEFDNPDALWTALFPLLIVYIVLTLIIGPASRQISNWIQNITYPSWTAMIRRQLNRYMYDHSYEYFQSDFAGRLAGKVVETPMACVGVVFMLAGPALFGLVSFTTALFLFSSVHWIYTILMCAMITCLMCNLIYFIPRIQKKSKRASDYRSKVRGRSVDIITNIMTVKLFARRKYEDKKFLEIAEQTSDKYIDLKLFTLRLWIIMEVLAMLFLGSIVITLYPLYTAGLLTISQIVMLLPLSIQVVQVSWWLTEISSDLFERLGEVQEGIETITRKHDLVDKKDAKALSVGKAHIELKDVSFSYGQENIFENLNLDIKPGQKIGIIGPSGAGKSTLIQILLRMYDIQGGSINIDGQNIADITQESLRNHIAAIPQVSDLLHRSIRENILYGDLDASEEEMIAAAKKASAHDFITELADKEGRTGYNTMVGERGVKLSGGQRQRVAIARAILKNAPILILDEATSALDSESEYLIQNSLKTLMEGKTVIAIAHRLSTIAHLDRLIVMEHGQIVEDGTHTELLENDGLYARLWNMQSGGFLADQ